MRALLLIMASAVTLLGHHSFAAEYDGKKSVTITGTVTQVDWRNPHAYIYLDVKDASGTVSKLAIEGHPPNILRRTGWDREAVKAQDTISVQGWASRDGSLRMAGREITLRDGKKLFWGPPSE